MIRKKALSLLSVGSLLLPTLVNPVHGATTDRPGDPDFSGLKNPAVEATLGSVTNQAEAGTTTTSYFITIWQGLITISALLLLVYLLWGAINWMSAGGDNSKVQKARDQMTNALIGFIILLGSFTIVGFIGQIVGFDLLTISFPTPGAQP